MKFIIETEQVIRRRYEVEAPGHITARDFLYERTRDEREQYRRMQQAEAERVVALQRVVRLPSPDAS